MSPTTSRLSRIALHVGVMWRMKQVTRMQISGITRELRLQGKRKVGLSL